MHRTKIASLFLSSIILYSCASPGHLVLDTSTKNEVPGKINEIIQKTGGLSDEDINITVYKSVISSVVAVNITAASKSIFSFRTVKGTGSGFFISKNGYILTNYHVVSGASKVGVTLSDNTTWTAQTIGGNKDKDIAVIKIDANGRQFPTVPFGDSKNISVGQKVLAIGAPFGLSGTLTTGIISSLNRKLPAEDGTVLNDIIQTDAAINPGNSGGPLINSNGEIIGINTAIFSPTGGNIGIGFAVPINIVKEAIRNIEIKI